MSTKLIKFHKDLCVISVTLVGALKSGGVWGQHPPCCFVTSCFSCTSSFPCYYISVLWRKTLRGWGQNLLKIFQRQMEWWGRMGLREEPALKWSNQLMEAMMGTSWHCLATLLHLPPLLSCPRKRAVLPLTSLWAQGIDQSAFPPSWLTSLCPKPACSAVL